MQIIHNTTGNLSLVKDLNQHCTRTLTEAVSGRPLITDTQVHFQDSPRLNLWCTKWQWNRFSSQYFCFHLSVSFSQHSMLILSSPAPLQLSASLVENPTRDVIVSTDSFSFVHWKLTRWYVKIKCQLDATEVFIADLIACSTCFGHHYAHHQELKSIIQWLLPVVFRAVVFKLLVWCGAEGYVSGLQDAAASCKPDT